MNDQSRTTRRRASVVDMDANDAEDQADMVLTFQAQLCQRQSALMLSGQGDRCLIELEAFGVDALLAHVGMAKFAKKTFVVEVREITDDERPKPTKRY